MKCRFCNTELEHVFIDLGNTPPSNSYLNKEQLDKPEDIYPLKAFVCCNCMLVQVDEHKKAEEIFEAGYAYFSSYSTSWLAHSKRYTEITAERFRLDGNSLVIEIASNDGYLLQYFNEKNIPVLGIEPTLGTAEVAIKKGINTIVDFFGIRLAGLLAAKNKKADLLLGNNVLAHVPDLNDFVGGLKILLKDDGVITMEFPHIMQLILNKQFDTIYHEHFSYFSLYTVIRVFEKHGLEIIDVDELPTHGGSLRIYAAHKGSYVKGNHKNIKSVLDKENQMKLHELAGYLGFQEKVSKVKNNFLMFLAEQKQKGRTIAAYGAAAKGNTLLNYCGIKTNLIDFVVDASPYKQGKFMPGSHIPIVHEEMIKKNKPDFIVILPWNIKDEIVLQLDYIKEWGGKFVVTIPNLLIQ